jgi:hypothetical protein
MWFTLMLRHAMLDLPINSGSVSTFAALALVNGLRKLQSTQPSLSQAVLAIKALQCKRFRHSYAVALNHPDWSQAAHFFLSHLYAPQDFSQRDAQFSRIAPSVGKFFPSNVVALVNCLAHLHATTEQLDHEMGLAMLALSTSASPTLHAHTYIACWNTVGKKRERELQLQLVQTIGRELTKLTQTPGLRLMLRMMHKPAILANLEQLQNFLEQGFDIFQTTRQSPSGITAFLSLIETQERAWIHRLFNADTSPPCDLALWPELI